MTTENDKQKIVKKKSAVIHVISALFPHDRFGLLSGVLAFILLSMLFFSFWHGDFIRLVNSSTYFSLSSPLSYYDAIAKVSANPGYVAPGYIPSTSFLLSLWAAPLKALGIYHDTSPMLYRYWMKLLFVVFFILSAFIFRLMMKEYIDDAIWANYSTAAWLSTPIVSYALFAFSQCDIIYVTFMLLGFLYFLRDDIWHGSLFFGISITFKYQPAYVFIPLLLLWEKRFFRIALCSLIFAAPMTIIVSIYKLASLPDSMEFITRVAHIGKLFGSHFNPAGDSYATAYVQFSIFIVICGLCYVAAPKKRTHRNNTAAYILLAGSACSIIFGIFNPYMTMFMCPGIALTSMIHRQNKRLLLGDIVGYLFFVGFISTFWYKYEADVTMFLGRQYWGMELRDNVYPLGDVFIAPLRIFVGDVPGFGPGLAGNIYYSCFIAFIIIHILTKIVVIRPGYVPGIGRRAINYHYIRLRLFSGILIFLLPVSFCLYKAYVYSNAYEFIESTSPSQKYFSALKNGVVWEQKFRGNGHSIAFVELQLATFMRKNTCTVEMEILDKNDASVAPKSVINAADVTDNGWHTFTLEENRTTKDALYRIRLTSPNGVDGNAITWWAHSTNGVTEGVVVNDRPIKDDEFAFRIAFNK